MKVSIWLASGICDNAETHLKVLHASHLETANVCRLAGYSMTVFEERREETVKQLRMFDN